MVTTYGPAWVPVCVDPPPPLLVDPPPLQDISPVPSAIRTAAESTCISRSEGDDADEFGLKNAKTRPIVPNTANHKATGEGGLIGTPKRIRLERAVVGTVTVNTCGLPLRGKDACERVQAERDGATEQETETVSFVPATDCKPTEKLALCPAAITWPAPVAGAKI